MIKEPTVNVAKLTPNRAAIARRLIAEYEAAVAARQRFFECADRAKRKADALLYRDEGLKVHRKWEEKEKKRFAPEMAATVRLLSFIFRVHEYQIPDFCRVDADDEGMFGIRVDDTIWCACFDSNFDSPAAHLKRMDVSRILEFPSQAI